MRFVKDYLLNPSKAILPFVKKYNFLFPDKLYLEILFKLQVGYNLNLQDPKTYNQKLNWLKLYDRNPLYPILVDKYAVKKWVADKVGDQYVIPTLGVWDKPEQIDFFSLPNEFVLKTTHGGGNKGVIICKDKSNFDFDSAIAKLNRALRHDTGKLFREWPYTKVPRRIIAEKYMIDSATNSLNDYKFFAFDGEVKAMFIATDRQECGELKFDYYDADFNHLDLVQVHPMSGKVLTKPSTFDEMKRIASILSKEIPQVRCDMYEVDGKVYFGEMTLFHHGGLKPFHPMEWDYEWGKYITLPDIS